MNRYSGFLKAPALLELPAQIVLCRIHDTRLAFFFYPSAEMQSVYFTSPANWATYEDKGFHLISDINVRMMFKK